jgi:Uma2 family endonuclease/CRP-like cAMP-binding protein
MTLSTIEKVLFLKSVRLFDQIPTEHLVKVAQIAQEVEFEPDEVFIKQGESGDCLYIVVEGAAQVILDGVGAINHIQAKGVIGEMALLSSEPRSASCLATDHLITLKIERHDLWTLMEARAEINLGIVKMLVQNLNLVNRQLQSQQSSPTVQQSLGNYVVEGNGSPNGKLLTQVEANVLPDQTPYDTSAEALVLEEAAAPKSEDFQAEISAMSGGSTNHNRIIISLGTMLDMAFERRSCEIFSREVRLLVPANGFYAYPDIMVVCGPVEYAAGRDDTITNPLIIIEVASKSTRDYERGQKFELYRDLTSLQDFVLIDQERIYIEYYHKLAEGQWTLTIFNQLNTKLLLTAVKISLPISRIYHKVDGLAPILQ